jgi:phosphatidylserine decarboxylase
LNNFFVYLLMSLVPKRLLSRLTGYVTRMKHPKPFVRALIAWFAARYKINVSEAEKPLNEYHCLNDFFTRRLRTGARPIKGPFIHPCDAVISQCGIVESGKLLQVKNWHYSLGELLGDQELANSYEGGKFATYYLCPTDYHRVHAPLSGNMYSSKHIPGALWPVNSWSVNTIRSLFCLNERVVMNFRSEVGFWSVVMVGATNVGQITIPLDETISTNRCLSYAVTDHKYDPPHAVRVGNEIGIFNMGSTVVVIYSKNFSGFDSVQVPFVTRLGQEV